MSSINRSMANETINEWDDEDVFQSGVRESTRLFGGVAAGTGQISSISRASNRLELPFGLFDPEHILLLC